MSPNREHFVDDQMSHNPNGRDGKPKAATINAAACTRPFSNPPARINVRPSNRKIPRISSKPLANLHATHPRNRHTLRNTFLASPVNSDEIPCDFQQTAIFPWHDHPPSRSGEARQQFQQCPILPAPFYGSDDTEHFPFVDSNDRSTIAKPCSVVRCVRARHDSPQYRIGAFPQLARFAKYHERVSPCLSRRDGHCFSNTRRIESQSVAVTPWIQNGTFDIGEP